MKYRFDTAIQFIDFHRFPLSIDENHSIASDFYQLTTPGLTTVSTKPEPRLNQCQFTKHVPVRRQLRQFADASFLLPKGRLLCT